MELNRTRMPCLPYGSYPTKIPSNQFDSYCLSIGRMSGETEELTVGETLNVNDVKVTVETYTTEAELREVEGDDTLTPTQGSIYLLIHIVFKNENDSQYELPTSSDLELEYVDEQAPAADIFKKTQGESGVYSSYRDTYTDAEAVFPGNSFSAWMIYLVPEKFEPSKAELSIEVEHLDEEVTGVWSFTD